MTTQKDLLSAKQSAFRLIKFRARSEKEIRDKLKDKGYEATVIDQAVEFLQKARFLDDALFAKLWVESRVKRFIGVKRLIFELKKKGIRRELIDKTLDAVLKDKNEDEAIRELIDIKLKKMRGLEPVKIMARLYGLLLRRGYPHDKVYSALQAAIKSKRVDELIP